MSKQFRVLNDGRRYILLEIRNYAGKGVQTTENGKLLEIKELKLKRTSFNKFFFFLKEFGFFWFADLDTDREIS